MGQDGSKKKLRTVTQSSVTKSTTVNNCKYVIVLHCSHTEAQVCTVDNFQDALESEADGMVEVSDTLNVAESGAEVDVPDAWLRCSSNLIVICLPSDLKAVESIAKVVRQKQLADKGNNLLSKVIAVAFGSSLPAGWPPSGVTRPAGGKKDFCFDKDTGRVLNAHDFEGRTLQSLLQTIVGMK